MKKRLMSIAILSLSLASFGLIACSSNDSPSSGGNSNSGTSTNKPSGVVPDNTDSGKNNSSDPDNVPTDHQTPSNPGNGDNTGGGNSGGGSNTGGSSGDNTGGGNSGGGSNTGGSSGDNTGGNSGGSNSGGNSGDNTGGGNSGGGSNTGGSSGDNTGGGNSGGSNTGGSSGDNTGGGNSGGGSNTGGNSGDNTGGGSSATPTWKLVFEDNFEGTDSIPNQEYWSLAKQGDKTWNRYMSESYGQAYQKNGYLYLFGMQTDDGEYLCGGIESLKKFDFTYGQVKCRARFLRQPQGNHTGIWMMPEPPAEQWPKSGEIDIMEHLNKEKMVWETCHFWDESTGADSKKDHTAEIDNEEFNVYGIIWDKESISFTVNGQVTFTYKNDNPGSDVFSYQYPFTKPFYLILSQSLGGQDTWEGPIDNSELPAIFQIDWIKVWEKE